VYKKLLAISLTAFIVTACGGSDSGSSTPGGNTGGNNGGNTGGNNGGNTGGNNGGGTGTVITGESGNFGDAGLQSNAVQGTYTLCPANVQSFSIFGQDNSGNWCVPGCPANAEDDDGDGFGSFLAANNVDRYACLVTPNAPGSQVQLYFSAPVNGCPAPAGCPSGSFPPVYISATAGDELAGNYQCTDWLFDVNSQDWSAQTSPAPFPLTLNVDRSANINGNDTTWSFSSGALILENNRTFRNVAVGNGSFTDYVSNVAITRCI